MSVQRVRIDGVRYIPARCPTCDVRVIGYDVESHTDSTEEHMAGTPSRIALLPCGHDVQEVEVRVGDLL